MEKHSICNGVKNISYLNAQPKIRALIPDKFKG